VIAETIAVPVDRAPSKAWSNALVRNLGVGLLSAPSIERLEEDRSVGGVVCGVYYASSFGAGRDG
jgi:hypothetical protein